MAILTGDQIEIMVRDGRITIDPFDAARCGPNSYDVTLSDQMRVYELPGQCERPSGPAPWDAPLDMAKDNPTRPLSVPAEGLVLWPGRLYLGCTREIVGSAEFVPWLDGRSSVARLGVCIHLTAGRGDLGFVGRFTCEITVVHPVRIYAGVRIGQVSFFATQGDRSRQYQGKYQGDGGPQPSRMYRDFAKGGGNG